ncbi:uncharacterized protein TNCV_1234001 [Trichonephila clavipes]|nr:uncharacterized protein TNCV_1234001 [Trichonephila clavipes]
MCKLWRNFTDNEVPWRVPNPDNSSDDKLAVHVGGAYWTPSSALKLYLHKWFNDTDSKNEDSILLEGENSSSFITWNKVVKFRDHEGTSIGQLEFLETGGKIFVDLTEFTALKNISSNCKEISFIAEDNTVNGDRYRAMITNFFIPELNNHDVQELWFQQDGATCHTARATIDLLKDTFGDRLISRFGTCEFASKIL